MARRLTGPSIVPAAGICPWYEQNNFGSYKSYHVMGRFSEFFGGYWHNDDFGMARCSTYGDEARPENLDLGAVSRGDDLGEPADRF